MARTKAWAKLQQARGEGDGKAIAEAQTEFDDMQDQTAAVLAVAQYQVLQAKFRTVMHRLSLGVVVGAVGLGLFAWAANPPDPVPPSAILSGANLTNSDLRDADLSGVDLTDANLTRANLSGATMTGTKLKGVHWSDTTCPDGSNSDADGDTCLGHLGP